ncbi:MAG: hypothetical protein RLZZ94_1027, partial [Bacteroidota bacterium]
MKCSGFVYSFGLAIGLFFVGFNFSATAQSNDLKSEGSLASKTGEGKTNVIKTEFGYQLYRNGLPYYVKGVGGDVNLD